MIRIREIGKLNETYAVVPGDVFRLYIHGEKVHETPIDATCRISHWAVVELGNSVGYFIGDETLQGDLEKLAGVKWTDRDLLGGLFDHMRDRMPGPDGPQKLGL